MKNKTKQGIYTYKQKKTAEVSSALNDVRQRQGGLTHIYNKRVTRGTMNKQ